MAKEDRADGGSKSARDRDEKGDKGDYEFVPPDFDEDAFIHREMVSFRTTLILFLWGIVAALVSWGVFAAMGGVRTGWLVGLGIMAVFGYGLRYLFPRLKADVKHFGRREWLGTAALFFFTWLSFFIVAVNPPVSDFAAPRVDVYPTPIAQAPGGEVALHLFVEDNVGVDEHTFRVTKDGAIVATADDLESLGHGHYRYDAGNLSLGTYIVEGTAIDGRGHDGNASAVFVVSEGIIDYSATGGGVLAGAADRILVTTDPVPACSFRNGQVNSRDACVRTVRLEMDSGSRVVTMEWDEGEQAWTATTAHQGWVAGNNTFDVVAELADRWVGSIRFDGGEVRDGPRSVDVRATPGNQTVVPAQDPGPITRSVPGIGVPLVALGILGLAVALRRRR